MNFEFFSVFFLARQKQNLAGREGYWTDDDGDEREGYWTNDDGMHLIFFRNIWLDELWEIYRAADI